MLRSASSRLYRTSAERYSRSSWEMKLLRYLRRSSPDSLISAVSDGVTRTSGIRPMWSDSFSYSLPLRQSFFWPPFLNEHTIRSVRSVAGSP